MEEILIGNWCEYDYPVILLDGHYFRVDEDGEIKEEITIQ